MRPSLLSFVAVVAAVPVLVACSRQEPAADPVRAVRTLTVAADTAGGTLDYAAEIRARVETRLSFRVGGKLVQRQVNLGDRVRAGQVIAQLDPQDLKLGQESAQASLASARANLDQAQADFARFKELRDKEFISAAELERRETTLKAARAAFQQAEAQVSVQANQTRYAVLVADTAGVVTGVDAEPGTVLAAGTPVVRLALDGPRDAVFAVPEDKVDLVRGIARTPGAMQVRLWGQDERTLPATLREVSAAADPVTRTFLVKADLGADGVEAVRLGQTATVRLDLPRTGGVTRLPLSALKEEQGRSIVWVVDRASMTVRPQPVQLGGADGNDAVVSAGLSPGQLVVTAGVHVLNPGQKVKLYGAPPAPAGAASAASAAKAGR
jgi:RND family efflux transporter MFP subunit